MNKKDFSTLFFSKTRDFLDRYEAQQLRRSENTIESYRDGLTSFRRFITNEKKNVLTSLFWTTWNICRTAAMPKQPATIGCQHCMHIYGMPQTVTSRSCLLRWQYRISRFFGKVKSSAT